MLNFAAAGLLFAVASSHLPASAGAPCIRQPLPPAMDSFPAVEALTKAITFSATPSLEYPGRAWVVRLSQSGHNGPAAVDIAVLRRQFDCNRYDVEKRWRAALTSEEFASLARVLAPRAIPAMNAPSAMDPLMDAGEGGIDGTSIMLRINTLGWDATRSLHDSGPDGAAVSSIFHAIVTKHVLPAEAPTAEWRVPAGRANDP